MREVTHNNGIVEIKVTTVTKLRFKSICIGWQDYDSWIDFHERYPKFKSTGRRSCSICHTPWKKKRSRINFAMVEKHPNICICDTCLSKIDLDLVPNVFDRSIHNKQTQE